VEAKFLKQAQQQPAAIQPNQKQAKKRVPQQSTLDLSNPSYASLPFQIDDVVEVFPIVKSLDLQNSDARTLM